MLSSRRIVGITALVGILVVGVTYSAPDMFTALIDMQRALGDEQSAALLLKQYVANEQSRLQDLQRYDFQSSSFENLCSSYDERNVKG